jgi:shikimate kinase
MNNQQLTMKELLKGLNIYLIGMMGSGKTTVGKLLAEELNYRFLDTDVLIESIVKKTINDIFKEDGEAKFRELESQILAEVSSYTKTVVSTGGGIVLKPINWSYLHHGLIIWLNAPVELLVNRLQEDDTRPLLQEKDLNSKLATLLQQRISLYQQADLHISIQESDTPSTIKDQIISLIPSKIKS